MADGGRLWSESACLTFDLQNCVLPLVERRERRSCHDIIVVVLSVVLHAQSATHLKSYVLIHRLSFEHLVVLDAVLLSDGQVAVDLAVLD